MNSRTENLTKQLEAAHKGMDQYQEALSALASNNVDLSDKLRHQIEVARERMEKYHAVYRALAK